jgi:YYY domain-containing protein
MGKSAGQVDVSPPIILELEEMYQLRLNVIDQVGAVSLRGAGIANESSWDDGLPLRMDGYDPFGGIYKGGLNFEMYWDDNPEKLTRFVSTLDQADFIMITSSRQWATTTRVPERYPLTTEYYRQLMGCPPPKQADNHPGDLMLPLGRLTEQREGGTWSDLFNPESWINRSQLVSVLVWYLAVFLLGLLVYPLMRKLLGGLNDYGYPLARTFGMLLFSYLIWLAGSTGIPVLRITTIGVLVLLTLMGIYTGYLQREDLLQEWDQKKKYFLIIEAIALGLFVTALLIRIGNPDLWHPWKGGEKPMDFSYFNAVLKSTTFPPYDPWFAGGFINYYYYGFVFVGMLVKLLGIVPALAYNLILPTLFMMLGLGAFSITWNLVRGLKADNIREDLSYLAGGTGVLGLLIFGNLGVLRMVFQGIQRLASAGVNVLEGSFFQRIKWTLLGFVQLFETKTLPYRMDEWYWNPSRVIGSEHGGPITEFPFFTFLYGDLHAHFIALPITVLALAWVISVVLSRDKSENRSQGFINLFAVPLFGALVVGALRPTNTWDFYPYLAFGTAALLFAMWQDFRKDKSSWLRSVVRIIIFLAFAMITFQPYTNWYGQGYTNIKFWYGTHTPVNDFLVHWGLFLFVIVTWMISETINWMATTPVSALSKLKKYRELILAALLILLVIIISFGVTLENKLSIGDFNILGSGVHIIWFVLPLMVWAAILLFRPDQSLEKSVVLFLIGTSLTITLMVELVYVVGDIGRMNTVFKFYLVAWTLFAVSGAVCLTWMIESFRMWKPPLKAIWQVVFYILVSSAALYPLLGGVAKIKDRMSLDAPTTLDGMAYMQTAVYHDLDTRLDLSQDYQAIRWMQDNIKGSPVIVEANQVEYHWATRYTVYTGLPGVVGWNWHQRQQRTLTPHDWVFSRVEDVNVFYDTSDLDYARDFLQQYQVSYIVLGQLERAKYSTEGIEKFLAGEGIHWKVVYQDQETVIYKSLLEIE